MSLMVVEERLSTYSRSLSLEYVFVFYWLSVVAHCRHFSFGVTLSELLCTAPARAHRNIKVEERELKNQNPFGDAGAGINEDKSLK